MALWRGLDADMAEARASVAKHPIHPMLVVIPLGLWTAALAFDVAVYLPFQRALQSQI